MFVTKGNPTLFTALRSRSLHAQRHKKASFLWNRFPSSLALTTPLQRPDALGAISRLWCPQTCAAPFLCLCPHLHQMLLHR